VSGPPSPKRRRTDTDVEPALSNIPPLADTIPAIGTSPPFILVDRYEPIADEWERFTASCNNKEIQNQWEIQACVWDVMDRYGMRNKETYVLGVTQLWERALREQGKDELFVMGWMLDQGIGFLKDEDAGVLWYQRAANQNHHIALHNLGVMYWEGTKAIQKNREESLRLFEKAALAGSAASLTELAHIYCEGEEGLAAADQPKALECLRLAGLKGYPAANNWLGLIYEDGDMGCEKDEVKALAYFTAAVAMGDSYAQNNLARFYEDGMGGVEVNLEKAVALYRLAAEEGVAESIAALGTYYETGEGGVPQDVKKAISLFEEASKDGVSTLAWLHLGWLYIEGFQGVVEPNPRKGVGYFWLAAEEGDERAAAELAVKFVEGTVLAIDEAKCAQFLKIAKEPIDGLFGPFEQRALE